MIRALALAASVGALRAPRARISMTLEGTKLEVLNTICAAPFKKTDFSLFVTFLGNTLFREIPHAHTYTHAHAHSHTDVRIMSSTSRTTHTGEECGEQEARTPPHHAARRRRLSISKQDVLKSVRSDRWELTLGKCTPTPKLHRTILGGCEQCRKR